jgi:hypothetical protein
MTRVWKWLLGAGALLALTVLGLYLAVWVATAGARQERRDREAAIRPLLTSHATREQVVQTLRLQFVVDYSVGSTNRWVIEQRVSDPGVRERADRYPGTLYHTTPEWMTWLFFDSEGRLQDCYICPQ